MNSNSAEPVYKTIMLVILTALITFIVTFFGTNAYRSQNNGSLAFGLSGQQSSSSELQNKLSYYRAFIDKYYIYDVNEEDVIDGAIKGYFAGLGDNYSEYITKEEMQDYMSDVKGKYVGIGVYIATEKKTNKIIVLSPMKDSPAEEAGIKAGDYILKVNGVEYKGEKIGDASDDLKTEEGSKVTLTIQRGEEIFDVEVETRTIQVNHIQSKVLNNNIGYVSIVSFDEGSYKDFVENYDKLKEQNVKGLIIDLRNNGGGIVDEAVEIADLFVDKDSTVLITKSKNKDESITKAKKEKEIDMPVVILINNNTASASEILTEALKDNLGDNVTIVGTKSHGKGVIQSVFTLKDGSGMKLTTEEYFSPNHNTINKVGITPDIEIELELPDGVTKYTMEEKDDNQLNKAIEVFK